MNNIFEIRIQKLFLIAFILKIGFSFLGWWYRDPWVLGFTFPLLIMTGYIILGYFRRDLDVSDEKFADTCYYLGFIFTITSIIFSLFDLPHIGTRIQDIAVRFGTAMVSTVLGLTVRVYLVSFRKDVGDAIKDSEDALLDATRKFTVQLTFALERLRDFESQVDTAAKASVERVNIQVENLSKNHADKLTMFFTELTNKNQEAFTSALAEVKSASQKLAESVDGYSLGMRANLGSIEAKVGAFTDVVTDRLKTTTFPDDYFAKHLHSPLTQLKDSSSALALGIHDSLAEVTASTKVLSTAYKKLRDKAEVAEGSLETVLRLTQQQQAVLDVAQGQNTNIELLGNTLTKIQETLAGTLERIATSNGLTSELTSRVSGVVADSTETRKTLEIGLREVTESLKAQVQATKTVVSTLDAGAITYSETAQKLISKLDTSTVAAESASATLTHQQQAVLDVAHGQNTTLEQLGSTLTKIQETLTGTLERIATSNGLTSELTSRVSGVVADSTETRKTLEIGLKEVTETLKTQIQATNTVVSTLGAGATTYNETTQKLINKLDTSTVATETASAALNTASSTSTAILGKIHSIAAAEIKAVHALGQHATSAFERVDGVVEQINDIVRQLTRLNSNLTESGVEKIRYSVMDQITSDMKIRDSKSSFQSLDETILEVSSSTPQQPLA